MTSFLLIQPTHHNGYKPAYNGQWTIDPFINTSMFFDAPLYQIDDSIPADRDVYWFVNFATAEFEKEIASMEFFKKMGKKIFLTFSHDLRFLIGNELMSEQGTLYTELCELADAIGSGMSNKIQIYGRYQHKVIDFGDLLFNNNYSIKPFKDRSIDLLTSGPYGEQYLPFTIELLLAIKEKNPDKRIVCLIRNNHMDTANRFIEKYPSIEFQTDGPLLKYLKDTKVYLNAENRPRPGRAIAEAYYCRVPFISCASTYFSKLCEEYTYDFLNVSQINDSFERILNVDVDKIIKTMEERAVYDSPTIVSNRIKNALGVK